MAQLSGAEVARLAMRAGFSNKTESGKLTKGPTGMGSTVPGEKYLSYSAAAVAVAIAKAESGWDPNARNARSGATGLWQIHPGGKQYLNPARNARAAHRKYVTQGWDAWSVFSSGAFWDHMNAAQDAIQNAKGVFPTYDKGKVERGLGIDIPNPLNALGDIVGFFRILFSGALWLRVAFVIGGGILLFVALNMLLSQTGIIQKTLKAVR